MSRSAVLSLPFQLIYSAQSCLMFNGTETAQTRSPWVQDWSDIQWWSVTQGSYCAVFRTSITLGMSCLQRKSLRVSQCQADDPVTDKHGRTLEPPALTMSFSTSNEKTSRLLHCSERVYRAVPWTFLGEYIQPFKCSWRERSKVDHGN